MKCKTFMSTEISHQTSQVQHPLLCWHAVQVCELEISQYWLEWMNTTTFPGIKEYYCKNNIYGSPKGHQDQWKEKWESEKVSDLFVQRFLNSSEDDSEPTWVSIFSGLCLLASCELLESKVYSQYHVMVSWQSAICFMFVNKEVIQLDQVRDMIRWTEKCKKMPKSHCQRLVCGEVFF